VQLFDSWAGLLDDDGFHRWAALPAARIVKALKKIHPNTPVIGFPRGAGALYPYYVREIAVDGIGIDQDISPEWARDHLQKEACVQGNLDPGLLLEGGRAMEDGAHKILDSLSRGPFIFNLGHGVIKETPPEHVEHLARIIRGYRV